MKKITVIGGDRRLKTATEILKSKGFIVDTICLYENDSGNISDSDVILLPVPTTRDKKTVCTPFSDKTILLGEVANAVSNKQLILSCGYTFENKKNIDYGNVDSYAVLNAIPTAEGAIKEAIENTDFTLWQSKVLVIGFGRVGKVLADRLRAMGCLVTISARKAVDFAFAAAAGYACINTNDINKTALDYEIIFNTVDKTVIDNNALSKCNSSLIIDLSSKGGLDLTEAKKLGIRAFMAAALPGKIAPVTAGEILAETVTDIINSYI